MTPLDQGEGTKIAPEEPRLTAKQWRSYSRACRRWNSRAASATLAVLAAEVACALAWAAWTTAIVTPHPKVPS